MIFIASGGVLNFITTMVKSKRLTAVKKTLYIFSSNLWYSNIMSQLARHKHIQAQL